MYISSTTFVKKDEDHYVIELLVGYESNIHQEGCCKNIREDEQTNEQMNKSHAAWWWCNKEYQLNGTLTSHSLI